MSTTVSYKGNTIATLSNETKTLTTAGKWLEADISITDSGGGSVTIEDVPNATGTTLQITTNGSGGGTPAATQHDIYFEFSDETDATITAYYDDSFISDAITATTPTTYGNKTVTLAQLDGVTWYEVSDDIPLNTELVDYNAVITNRIVGDNGTITTSESWDCVTDYIPIDPSMTFTFICRAWYNIGFYNSNKSSVRVVSSNDIAGSTVTNDYTHGTLTPSVIPSSAAYVVLSGSSYALNSNYLSLIRTA